MVKFIKKSNKNLILSLLICLIIALFIINPYQNMQACYNGLVVWCTSLVPALLPFFFLTRILGGLGLFTSLGNKLSPFTNKMYNCPGISAYVYIMSIISGYPVGAKLTADLYTDGKISKGQAERITTFTCTSGPLFIMGTVGSAMFGNVKLGIWVFVCHILGATLNGLLYRKHSLDSSIICNMQTQKKDSNMLENAMHSSISSVTVVGGYVALFFMIISMINTYNLFLPITNVVSNLFNVDGSVVNSICNGLVEMTRGCLDLSKCPLSFGTQLILLTGLISFGGVSIHLQALTFLKKFNISIKFYLKQKCTQTIISIVIALVISIIT